MKKKLIIKKKKAVKTDSITTMLKEMDEFRRKYRLKIPGGDVVKYLRANR